MSRRQGGLRRQGLQPRRKARSRSSAFQHADRRGGDERWAFTPAGEDATELFQFICEMARLTWAEIERQQTGGRDRHRKHHDQEVDSICPEAKADFDRCKLGERFGETLFRFRLSGEKRLWGFRVGTTFHVIWWDPGHEVCPVDR